MITATSKSENTETSIGGPHTDGIDTRSNQEEADTRTTGNDDIDTDDYEDMFEGLGRTAPSPEYIGWFTKNTDEATSSGDGSTTKDQGEATYLCLHVPVTIPTLGIPGPRTNGVHGQQRTPRAPSGEK